MKLGTGLRTAIVRCFPKEFYHHFLLAVVSHIPCQKTVERMVENGIVLTSRSYNQYLRTFFKKWRQFTFQKMAKTKFELLSGFDKKESRKNDKVIGCRRGQVNKILFCYHSPQLTSRFSHDSGKIHRFWQKVINNSNETIFSEFLYSVWSLLILHRKLLHSRIG